VTQYLKPPPGNPIVQLLAALGAIVGLVVSFILGFFALAIIAGFVLVGMLVIGIRVAWMKRRLEREMKVQATVEQPTESGETLDAEFEVISRTQDR